MKQKIDLWDKRKMSRAGQIVIPEKLREFMEIKDGDEIIFVDALKDENKFIVTIRVLR